MVASVIALLSILSTGQAPEKMHWRTVDVPRQEWKQSRGLQHEPARDRTGCLHVSDGQLERLIGIVNPYTQCQKRERATSFPEVARPSEGGLNRTLSLSTTSWPLGLVPESWPFQGSSQESGQRAYRCPLLNLAEKRMQPYLAFTILISQIPVRQPAPTTGTQRTETVSLVASLESQVISTL